MRTASRTPASDGWGRAILAGAVIAALGGGAHHLLNGPRKHDVSTAPKAARVEARAQVAPRPLVAAAAPVEAARAEAAAQSAPVEVPRSLLGTSEDGALRADESGNLVIEPAVLRFFDYYLSATGEEGAAAIRARVVAAIQRRFGAARAGEQAISLFDTYVGYRESTKRLPAGDAEVGARLEGLKALRRRVFGAADAEKLFGGEERALAVALEQRRVLGEAGLTPEERDARLAALEQRLPEAERAAREEATHHLRRRAEEDALRAGGATDEDVRAYRVASVGEAAADRLAALDRRRAEWRSRLDAFRAARAEIQRSEPDPERQRARVQKLLDDSFSSVEQIRVDAADKMDAP